MTRQERISIARIVTDMIKADNIIEESEIETLNELKMKYGLDSKVLSEALKIKFSDAIVGLSEFTDEEKIQLFNDLKKLAGADGLCVPREAMLLLAIRYSFGIERGKTKGKYVINHERRSQIISCPTGEDSVISQYAIYIEGRKNEEINRQIEKDFRQIVLEFRQRGFDFIYIPTLVEEFKEMRMDYVKDVIRFMAPDLSDEVLDNVYDRLLHMNTVKFCNKVLAEKLHVNSVKQSEPSLFINIGMSVVPYSSTDGTIEYYTEFLKIPLGEDMKADVIDFVKSYERLASIYTVSALTAPKQNGFKYFGFYKALFDFLVKAEPMESDLLVHTWNSIIEFPDLPIPPLKLQPQEAAVYKLILQCTMNHSSGGLLSKFDSKSALHEIEQMYAHIYHKDGAVLPSNLAPIRSKIENKIRKHAGGKISNIDDYIPQLVNGKYIVRARPERIKIGEYGIRTAESFEGYVWP